MASDPGQPNSNTVYENRTPDEVLRDKLMSMVSVGVREKFMSTANLGAGDGESVVTFEGIAILTPRGRYSVELHRSFLRLEGQANYFIIEYSSIVRLFLLPKSNQPHTFLVVTLDPPICKGQTLYPHIVLKFETDCIVKSSLSLSEDILNTKYEDKLESSYEGPTHEVFTTILCGLSNAKVSKPGKFRSFRDGNAVKSSLKAEDGVLYPLEKCFFFLPKPPTLILHAEIDHVEFKRLAGGFGSNLHYFDLLITLKTEQEHLFRNIQRDEYRNLFDFISRKGLKIIKRGNMRQTAVGVAAFLQDDDDDVIDPHLVRIKNKAGNDETDKEKPSKKDPKKEASSSKASSSSNQKPRDEGDEDPKKKKQKRKKDPNAPKRALSGFMFFAQTERENLKKSNPGIAFTEVGRVLGSKWKNMSVEEKEPYEAKAQQDRKRYKDAISSYKPTTCD